MKLPQLTLRDLFWLVLACALVVAWWLDRRRLAGQLAEEKSRVQSIISRLSDSDLRSMFQDDARARHKDDMTYSGVLIEIIPDKPDAK